MKKDAKKREKLIEKVQNIIRRIVSLFVILAVIATGIAFVCYLRHMGENRRTEMETFETRKIKSCILTSKSSEYVSGTFILGSGGVHGGSIEDIQYFFYMEGKKGFGLECLEASKVEIIPITEGTPHIEGHFDENGDLYKFYHDSDEYNYVMGRYYLYLPAEYIVEEYDVDTNNVTE